MYYIGIDIGGMSIKCGIVDGGGNILNKMSAITPVGDFETAIAIIAKLCRDTAANYNIAWEDVAAIGAGIPGTTHKGVVSFASNLSWYNVPFDEALAKATGKPVFSGNDANCALLAEWHFGKAKGLSDVAMVTLGTGIGTAFIIDNRLLLGNMSAGTEGGHIVIKSNGRDCNCGLKDCWEVYASTTALIRSTEQEAAANPDGEIASIAIADGGVTGKTIFQAIKKGDRRARELFDGYVQDVAIGLINLTNLLRPQLILIGGGISNEEELLIRPLEKIVNEKAYGGRFNPFVRIERAGFANDAGIIGAACLAIE